MKNKFYKKNHEFDIALTFVLYLFIFDNRICDEGLCFDVPLQLIRKLLIFLPILGVCGSTTNQSLHNGVPTKFDEMVLSFSNFDIFFFNSDNTFTWYM